MSFHLFIYLLVTGELVTSANVPSNSDIHLTRFSEIWSQQGVLGIQVLYIFNTKLQGKHWHVFKTWSTTQYHHNTTTVNWNFQEKQIFLARMSV